MNNIHIYLHYNCKYFIQNTWNNSNIPLTSVFTKSADQKQKTSAHPSHVEHQNNSQAVTTMAKQTVENTLD